MKLNMQMPHLHAIVYWVYIRVYGIYNVMVYVHVYVHACITHHCMELWMCGCLYHNDCIDAKATRGNCV